MNRPDPVLNAPLIVERRLALKLSPLDLAQELGVSTVAIRSLENGRNHHQLNLHFLGRLAQILGLQVVELFRSAQGEASLGQRSAKAQAALALAGQGLAPQDVSEAFGWTLDETHAAYRELRELQTHTGLRVAYSAGRYALMPATALLSEKEIKRLERAKVRRRRITESEARLLSQTTEAGFAGKSAGDLPAAARPVAARLLRLGWIEERGGRLHTARDVQINLGLGRPGAISPLIRG